MRRKTDEKNSSRDARPVGGSVRRGAVRGVSRNTLTVAHALDTLAASLPDTVHPRKAVSAPSKRVVPMPAPWEPFPVAPPPPAARPSPRAVQTAPPRDVPVRPDRPFTTRESPLNVRSKDAQTCKERPADSRKSGGSGASRPFIPWCSKRS